MLAAITEFPLSTPFPSPGTLTVGPDGNLWFPDNFNPADQDGSFKIGRITPTGEITEFPLPFPSSKYGTVALTVGLDGNLWFPVAGKIDRITPSGAITESAPLSAAGLSALTAGPDGNLWLSEWQISGSSFVSGIGRITLTGEITEFPLHSGVVTGQLSLPGALAVGPDGNLWFPEGGMIGRITPSGTITEFPIPSNGSASDSLTVGPDGNLWFPEGGMIGRITPSGTITEFPIPSNGSASDSLTVGPDDNLWFPEGQKIGRITPTGAITEFALPFPSQGDFSIAGPLTVGPDGNLFFPETFYVTVGTIVHFQVPGGGWIDRITPSGDIIRIPGITGGAPGALTVGPDGNLWFPEQRAIGRLNLGQIIPDQPLTATAVMVAPTAGIPFSGTLASFTDADPAGTPGSYSVTINWGDGSPREAGKITANGSGGFVVNGAHTYIASGTNAVTVVITDIDTSHDIGGATAVAHTTANVASPPPSVESLHRIGVHRQPTHLTLTFSQALDPALSQDRSNYRIVLAGPAGRVRPHARPIPIAAAVYDPATHSVTLTPRQRLNLHGYYRLTVSGQPASDYVALVHGFGPVAPREHPKVEARPDAAAPAGPLAHGAAARKTVLPPAHRPSARLH